MTTIDNFIAGIRMAEKFARTMRERIDQRIAKDIEFDQRKSSTLRGVTQIADEASRDAQATLDDLLIQLASLLKMLDEQKGQCDAK